MLSADSLSECLKVLQVTFHRQLICLKTSLELRHSASLMHTSVQLWRQVVV